jgi:hypothetical protein
MVASKRVKVAEEHANANPTQFDTPTHTRVRDITAFCQDQGVDISQNDIFSWCGVSKQRGYEMLQDDSQLRRKHNRDNEDESRGRKPIFGETEWEILEDFINSEGFEGRVCGYEEIVTEVLPYLYKEHPNLHLQTIRTAFEDRGYHKCVACQKPWLSKESLTERRQYLKLRKDWTKEQWRKVRFSDEVHFGQGPRRKLKVIRKRGQRYHPDCIQATAKPEKIKHKNLKRYYIWAVVGYSFKSRLVFYETNYTNGKLT